jgi:hypothetical protein
LLGNRVIAILETPMDEDSRRSLHQLIVRAVNKDAHATAAIEEMIMGLDRSGSADDVTQSLQMIVTIGGDELHKSIVARTSRERPPWTAMAHDRTTLRVPIHKFALEHKHLCQKRRHCARLSALGLSLIGGALDGRQRLRRFRVSLVKSRIRKEAASIRARNSSRCHDVS